MAKKNENSNYTNSDLKDDIEEIESNVCHEISLFSIIDDIEISIQRHILKKMINKGFVDEATVRLVKFAYGIEDND